MSEPLRQLSEAGATAVTVSKVGITGSTIATIGASFAGQNEIAVVGLIATIIFGIIGVVVNFYFRFKEDRRREREHKVTMKRLRELHE
jgi:hypothetical protein